jgi:hypothetical protein
MSVLNSYGSFCCLFARYILPPWRRRQKVINFYQTTRRYIPEYCILQTSIRPTFFSSPPPLWRYSPNSGLGLPPWNFPFHFSLLHVNLRQSVGLLGWVISSSQGLYLYTDTEKRTHIHKHQTSMPWVGFEPKIPASEWAKTVHALGRWATVTGIRSTK